MYVCDYCQTEGAELTNSNTGFMFHRDCARKYDRECGLLTPQDAVWGNYRELSTQQVAKANSSGSRIE